MEFSDYFVNLVLSGILIVGAYQFYFSPNASAAQTHRMALAD